jgi:plasmid stability protein
VKNITVTVSDELYHAARIKAAQKHTTISAIVRDKLQQLVAEAQPSPHDQLFDTLDRIRAERRGAPLDMSENLTREELYDRSRR